MHACTHGKYSGPHPQEVETQLQKYRASVDDINKHSAAGAREGVYVDPDELIRRNTHNLMAAVSSLPELQVRARMHVWMWQGACARPCAFVGTGAVCCLHAGVCTSVCNQPSSGCAFWGKEAGSGHAWAWERIPRSACCGFAEVLPRWWVFAGLASRLACHVASEAAPLLSKQLQHTWVHLLPL